MYEFSEVQELYPQGDSHIYSQSFSRDILSDYYIDNELYADNPISEIVWYVEGSHFVLSGVIAASMPANLTIAGSNLELRDVEFSNIWSISLVGDASISYGAVTYGDEIGANITLDGIGTKENPVYNLRARGNIDLRGSNYVMDLSSSGERFSQEDNGSAIIPSSLSIDNSIISFSDVSLLDVGEYHLRFIEMSYEGLLDARRGNLAIEYLGDGNLDIRQNLRAVGVVRIHSDREVNNHGQIIGNILQVEAPIFSNYGVINVNYRSEFVLKDNFYNANFGYIKTDEFYVGSNKPETAKIKLIKNEGRIEIGYGELHSDELFVTATGFVKSDFEKYGKTIKGGCTKGKSFHNCNIYQENIKSYPVLSILTATGDLHLDIRFSKLLQAKFLLVRYFFIALQYSMKILNYINMESVVMEEYYLVILMGKKVILSEFFLVMVR